MRHCSSSACLDTYELDPPTKGIFFNTVDARVVCWIWLWNFVVFILVVDWEMLAVSYYSSTIRMLAGESSVSFIIATCAVGFPFLFLIWYVCRDILLTMFWVSEISELTNRPEAKRVGDRDSVLAGRLCSDSIWDGVGLKSRMLMWLWRLRSKPLSRLFFLVSAFYARLFDMSAVSCFSVIWDLLIMVALSSSTVTSMAAVASSSS